MKVDVNFGIPKKCFSNLKKIEDHIILHSNNTKTSQSERNNVPIKCPVEFLIDQDIWPQKLTLEKNIKDQVNTNLIVPPTDISVGGVSDRIAHLELIEEWVKTLKPKNQQQLQDFNDMQQQKPPILITIEEIIEHNLLYYRAIQGRAEQMKLPQKSSVFTTPHHTAKVFDDIFLFEVREQFLDKNSKNMIKDVIQSAEQRLQQHFTYTKTDLKSFEPFEKNKDLI